MLILFCVHFVFCILFLSSLMPLKKSSLSVSTNLMYIHLSFQIYGHYGGMGGSVARELPFFNTTKPYERRKVGIKYKYEYYRIEVRWFRAGVIPCNILVPHIDSRVKIIDNERAGASPCDLLLVIVRVYYRCVLKKCHLCVSVVTQIRFQC